MFVIGRCLNSISTASPLMAVLRHMGVPLGKADYVGYVLRHLRPGTAPAG